MKMLSQRQLTYPTRGWIVLVLMTFAFVALGGRAAWIQIVKSGELEAEGEARYTRVLKTPAKRGMVLDRNGEALAISTRVKSVWMDPRVLSQMPDRFDELAESLAMDRATIEEILEKKEGKAFAYLRRHLARADALEVEKLGVPGVAVINEYRRYYPMGSVTGHVVGLTNKDDFGQSGLELILNDQLTGVDGMQRVRNNRRGTAVENVERIAGVRDGADVSISIDTRVQYIAAAHLGRTVQEHNALAGTAVIVDVKTGEVIAMVNSPTFNPNNRRNITPGSTRNRAITDLFEPGSTMKPFTVAAAIESTYLTENTLIDTSPGYARIGRFSIRDTKDYGALTVAEVIAKSSNIGAARIALEMDPAAHLGMLDRFGFGRATDAEFPGQRDGGYGENRRWGKVQRAALSYGYGVDVTALQLVQSYAALANDGVMIPITMLKRTGPPPEGTRVLGSAITAAIVSMLEQAASVDGTGSKAQVSLYRIAGKTGTVKKSENGVYQKKKYRSLFAGFAPVTNPRLAMVVIIDEPRNEYYYGGAVAAPVFSRVMSGALRLMNVAPDAVHTDPHTLLASGTKSLPPLNDGYQDPNWQAPSRLQ